MPTTTSSAGSREPSASSTAPGSTAATPVPQRSAIPASAYQAAIARPTSVGSAPGTGAGPASTTVTSQPACRAAVATSAPIQPAPTSTRRSPGRSRARSASASSRVCSRWARSAPGRTRGSEPVAISSASYRTSPASVCRVPAVPGPGVSPVARRPVSSSTSSCPKSRSRAVLSVLPSRTSLESGGRSYGACGSSPTSVIRPSQPSRRSTAAHCAPASPAPTTTTRSVCPVPLSSATPVTVLSPVVGPPTQDCPGPGPSQAPSALRPPGVKVGAPSREPGGPG